MTIGEALKAATARLASFSDSPRLDAELLMAEVLGKSRGALYGGLRDPLEETAQPQFEDWITRRADGEPIAYLLGHKEFWSLDLQVTPEVLVPRPETELLVEWALSLIDSSSPRKRESSLSVMDLGTGSGAIILSLAHELSNAELWATDVSASALAVARANAQQLGGARVHFVEACWLQQLDSRLRGSDDEREVRFDFILSNPPYLSEDDLHLPALAHEPRAALVAGVSGLEALREIVDGASSFLKPAGWLLLEHGYQQAHEVRELLAAAGYSDVQTRRDLAGIERATGGRWA